MNWRFHRWIRSAIPESRFLPIPMSAEFESQTSNAMARATPYPPAPAARKPDRGRRLQQDSAGSDRSRRPEDDQPLSAAAMRAIRRWATTTPTCRCGSSTKASSTSAWTTISPARTRSSPASATIRQCLRSRRLAGIRRAQRLCQHAEYHQPRAQCGDIGNPHLFLDHTINQFSAGFNRIFNHIRHSATGAAKPAKSGFWAQI